VAYYARNMVNMIRDSRQVGLRPVRSHVFRDKVDLSLEGRQLLVSVYTRRFFSYPSDPRGTRTRDNP
jgi:hypothetical protein